MNLQLVIGEADMRAWAAKSLPGLRAEHVRLTIVRVTDKGLIEVEGPVQIVLQADMTPGGSENG